MNPACPSEHMQNVYVLKSKRSATFQQSNFKNWNQKQARKDSQLFGNLNCF